jgi:gliding motility-associated-like protein
MRKFLIIALLSGFHSMVQGQSILAYPDTIICSTQPVWLHALVDGTYGTETYSYIEVPFAPEPVGGTVHNMIDDTHTGPFSIGFEFCYFGETYTQFYIASNGWISFLNPSGAMDVNWTPNGPIPDAAADVPKAAIFAPWTDWHSGLCTNCIFHEVVGVAPFRKLIVTYDEVPLFSCTGYEGTFQFVLHETTNQIDNHLTAVDVCPGWDLGIATQGIINEDGTEAYTIAGRNATDWSANDESWVWLPSAITWYETVSGTVIGTGDSILVTPDVTTSYTAEVLLCDGTTVSDEVIVTITTPYDVTVDVQNIVCNGTANAWIDVDVSGNTNPVSYTWSTGSIEDSIYNLGPGVYTITVQEVDGCAFFQEITITEPPVLLLDSVLTVDVTCFGGNDGQVQLNADGGVTPYIFSYNGTDWQTDSLFTTLEAGVYTFRVKDANGCEVLFSNVIISEPPPTIVDAGPNFTIEYGSFAILEATTDIDPIISLVWTPAEGLSCTDCLQPTAAPSFNTTYYITVTDANGCIAIDSVNVWVNIDFNVPNAFTPNGDGLNDYFNIQTDLLISYNISIFDRWGNMVFNSSDILKGWDGNFAGKPLEIGTYVYFIESVTTLNTPINKTGTIALLR